MFCALLTSRFQVSVYRTNGPLVLYMLPRRSIFDLYLRSCGYVTCSRQQRTATGGLEPGTSRPKVIGFTTARVRSTEGILKAKEC